MTARQLREWLVDVPDQAIIEHRFVSWDTLNEHDLRAVGVIRHHEKVVNKPEGD
jgi:hypothetical protein